MDDLVPFIDQVNKLLRVFGLTTPGVSKAILLCPRCIFVYGFVVLG